jgi:hypothetical protein
MTIILKQKEKEKG